MPKEKLSQHQAYFILPFINNVTITAVSLSSGSNIFAVSCFFWTTENL